MDASAESIREAYRQGDGKFGTQQHSNPGQLSDLVPTMPVPRTEEQRRNTEQAFGTDISYVDIWSEQSGSSSFEYPPQPTSAAQVIDFWSRVEVPDEVARSLEAKMNLEYKHRYEEYYAEAKRWAGPATPDQYDERHRRIRKTVLERFEAEREERGGKLPRECIKPLARLIMMHAQASKLPEEETVKVRRLPISPPDVNRQMNVETYLYHWRARGLSYLLRNERDYEANYSMQVKAEEKNGRAAMY